MNLPLYKKMLKIHAKGMWSYGTGAAVYLLLIISVFPSIAGSEEMDQIIKQMPKGWVDAFSLENGMGTLTDFIAGKFYGLIFIIILSIYSIMTASQLMARLIEQGSIAYLISASVSRKQIAFTQIAVLLTGLILIVGLTLGAGVGGAFWFLDSADFQIIDFVKLNLIAFLLFYVISSYSFYFSASAHDEKKALSLSAGLTLLFYVLDLAAKLSDSLDWLQYFTLFTVFNTSELLTEDYPFWGTVIGLAACGTVLYILAVQKFTRRDLSI
ncbi:ABC-2 type transport system permease protein [Bacillus ectoiniformans]|uniref:ABC transporter permease subunit n=1 Tax=Bacillus ectoiniformans TaxID=1494429 RepID=UPI001956B3D5|nr:ABC transporter permease subunit [Bacillus ectoiniformans]MBM7647877.1 ABC-2 type transport system permease protein [Bacillus ectoiniformans]